MILEAETPARVSAVGWSPGTDEADFGGDGVSDELKLDFHIWFRGQSKSLGMLIPNKCPRVVQEYVFDAGVGETDSDPLYLFANYKLKAAYVPVSSEELFLKIKNVLHVKEKRVFELQATDSGAEGEVAMANLRKPTEQEYEEFNAK